MLIAKRMIAKEIPRESPLMFVGLDPSNTCDFRMGEKRHTTDNCLVLKAKVQDLMDNGVLSLCNRIPSLIVLVG